MDFLNQKDLNLVATLGGAKVNVQDHKKLKTIYLKLEKLAEEISKRGYKFKIRKDPRNQGGGFKYFQEYLWVKIFPAKYFEDASEKFSYIVGINGALHFHMMGIKAFQNKKASVEASTKCNTVISIANENYVSLAQKFVKFDQDYRTLFLRTGSDLGIKSFEVELNNIKLNNLKNLLKSKKQIILQGPPGTGKTRLAKEVAHQLIFDKQAVTEEEQKAALSNSEQFKIVQFHASYTYEDFVREISVDTTDSGMPEYKVVNRILGAFAKTANESNLQDGVDDFKRAWSLLIEDITNEKITKVGTSDVLVSINTQGNIKFKSPVATFDTTYQLYKFGETDLRYETYQKIVLAYLKKEYDLKDFKEPVQKKSEKAFVLIIDEINRANLSSVLGELIYALEYRGEKVDSMYATVEDKNTIILPENLFIIGTMNTADRSVGHIDYAIRRRFAFESVLPQDLTGQLESGYAFAKAEFDKVKALFVNDINLGWDNTELKNSKYLSDEFDPKDVCIGHSYFIHKEDEDISQRMKYEIIPILEEYIKDGVLKDSSELRKALEEL